MSDSDKPRPADGPPRWINPNAAPNRGPSPAEAGSEPGSAAQPDPGIGAVKLGSLEPGVERTKEPPPVEGTSSPETAEPAKRSATSEQPAPEPPATPAPLAPQAGDGSPSTPQVAAPSPSVIEFRVDAPPVERPANALDVGPASTPEPLVTPAAPSSTRPALDPPPASRPEVAGAHRPRTADGGVRSRPAEPARSEPNVEPARPSRKLDFTPYDEPPGRRGGPSIGRGVIVGGVVGALMLAALAALLLRPGADREETVAAQAPTGSSSEASDSPTTARADEPYRPPDREAVQQAYARVDQVFKAEGASGLARFGQRCFRGLEQKATYRELDFCLAFDAYGAAVNQRATGGQPPAPGSYFAQTEARQIRVASAVMAGEGDANARLTDIRRLAIEVAREYGPIMQATRTPSGASGPPPTGASAPTPPASPRPEPPPQPPIVVARGTEAAGQRPPVVRTPPPPPPVSPPARAPRSVDREAYAAARELDRSSVSTAPPTAAEVAAARPAGRGPSFNCRYARSRSERLVCGDPSLAALDRRLNAAFEDAIASGADRRELRREQDGWLATREAAAPDPDAVADVYRRRIGELNAQR